MIILKQFLGYLVDPKNDWRLCILHNWQSIVGSLKTRVRLEKVYGSTVVIGVYESHWMHELFLLSKVLISSINKHLDMPRITNLKFKLIEQRPQKQKYLEVKLPLHKPLYQPTYTQKRALAAVSDKELARVLESFLIRCMEME